MGISLSNIVTPYVVPLLSSDEIVISQGWNGPWSHKQLPGQDSRFAIDFALPTGNPVKAARGGIVVATLDNSTVFYDGEDPEIGLNLPVGSTNLLAIVHPDETIATYVHFKKGGIFVREGQRIERGQLLGLTGLSGWIGKKPHIHFQVNNSDGESLPVRFWGYKGPLEHNELFPPKRGKEIA